MTMGKHLESHKLFAAKMSKWLRLRCLSFRLRRRVYGIDNDITHRGARLYGVTIDMVGDHNRIVLEEGCLLRDVTCRVRGNHHRIIVRRDCRFQSGATIWMEDEGGGLEIGAGSSFGNVSIAVTEPGSAITIGEDCMFAYDIDLRTGDSHSILSQATRERLNPAADIRIGNHVWVAAHSILLKGTAIPDDSVVATGAVVTGAFSQPGVIVGGNPARVMTEGITWMRERRAE